MKAIPSVLKDACALRPVVHRDDRGWFHEVARSATLRELGIDDDFVQENQSRSARGTIRGLHFQYPDPQAKIVRCARGAILDVIVDLRVGSPTFGRFETWVLDDEECIQVYCPVGFAHGFMVLSDVADVVYRCSSYYAPEAQWGVRHDDADLAIPWGPGPHRLSHKDLQAPTLSEITDSLPFRYHA